jgi:hypothetical protein
MGIFNRKPKVEPAPAPEVGNANIAKQVKYKTLHIDSSSPATRVATSPVVAQTTQSAPIEADPSKPFYSFTTSLDGGVQRSRAWYITAAVFFGIIVAINVVLQLYMSAIVVVLLGLLLFTTASRKKTPIQVHFFAQGLELQEKMYPWSEFEKFWILYEPPTLKRLFFKRRGKILSELVIELANENPLKIRDLLLPLLPEDQTKEESRVDLVTRSLKL